ncbi:MAG: hypothetical protein ACAI25_05455 [Planctomycetota bacterium]
MTVPPSRTTRTSASGRSSHVSHVEVVEGPDELLDPCREGGHRLVQLGGERSAFGERAPVERRVKAEARLGAGQGGALEGSQLVVHLGFRSTEGD